MDFFTIERHVKEKERTIKICPKFIVCRSKDLFVRKKNFQGIFNEQLGLWSTDIYEAMRIVDEAIYEEYNKLKNDQRWITYDISMSLMSDFDSGSWQKFNNYINLLGDNAESFDGKIIFADKKLEREDHATFQLPYVMSNDDTPAYDELVSTLYDPQERLKFEWAVGSIIAGKSTEIQKFFVFYGGPGTGKSTILDIIQKMLDGYWISFESKRLGSGDTFALEMFRSNPLIAIEHDGDLSKIEDNTRLNSIVAHEPMSFNEKNKSSYTMTPRAMMFIGTNSPVKITDAKSGIKRRLVDIHPTGNKIESNRFFELKNQILQFELGGIAFKCYNAFIQKGKDFYKNYEPIEMSYKTDMFFNFMDDNYLTFARQDGISLKQAYDLYVKYAEENHFQRILPKMEVRERLSDYFEEHLPEIHLEDGSHIRHYFRKFKKELFDKELLTSTYEAKKINKSWIEFKEQPSKLDILCSDEPAQYATDSGTPRYAWDYVVTKLKDIDTRKLHYVNWEDIHHIVIDFDLKDDNGEKSLELNLKEASKWPKTYAELSKSGKGIHLHYIYSGDPEDLAAIYSDCVEIKVFTGKQSCRRKLTLCNDIPIATINSGLPLKELKGGKMIDYEMSLNDKSIRCIIINSMNKKYHGYTKPSMEFIKKILDDAYEKGIKYDVRDLYQALLTFATNSTHNADYCLKILGKLHLCSDAQPDEQPVQSEEAPIIILDVEVLPNLYYVGWKFLGKDKKPVHMFNPTPDEVSNLFKYRIVGFNCRRYDNHTLYARSMGYTEKEIFNLSQKIIVTEKGQRSDAFFANAYNISYADIYDYATKKQSLKKWEIELGLPHKEFAWPWDQDLPEDKWSVLADYCDNDLYATEAVWEHTQEDFIARCIIADIAGLTPNDTTNNISSTIVFGKGNKKPWDSFNFPDPAEEFPGYSYVDANGDPLPYENNNGYNMYNGEDVSKGGVVRAIPGTYVNVWTFDVSSMHPSTIIALNLFGDIYTPKFAELVKCRKAIKHGDFDTARKCFGGKIAKYLDDPSKAKKLANALKIVINSFYGLTSAKFENPARDPRNGINIVALRGGLFMLSLRDKLISRGVVPIHIKTDSIKIVNPDKETIDFIMSYGKKYGYDFEVEHKFEKFCLVNNAVYIAKLAEDDEDWMDAVNKAAKEGKDIPTRWTATGAQFAEPYVFKTLFSKEDLEFDDYCQTKNVVKGEIYIDMNESLPEGEHNYVFVGRVGSFIPVVDGSGGGSLVCYHNNKYDAVTGTKGYKWMESETAKELGKEDAIDISYYEKLRKDAIISIQEHDPEGIYNKEVA